MVRASGEKQAGSGDLSAEWVGAAQAAGRVASSGSQHVKGGSEAVGAQRVESVREESRERRQTKRLPNVVVVLADDMGWGDVGCYGATRIPTPAMDRLAAEGVRATDCHSASAVCTPSRYAILTGRYAWRGPLKQGVLWGHSPAIIEPDRPTLASMLEKSGYATGAFGKWHLGLGWHFRDGRVLDAREPGTPLVAMAEVDNGANVDYSAGFVGGPTELGFDRFFGMTGSLDMPPYCFLDQDHTLGIPDRPKAVYLHKQRQGLQVADWHEDAVDTRFSEEACAWIRTQAADNRPFFCYLALSAPHRPCVPPSFARGSSQAGARGDMVAVVDWVVERILKLLDELDLAADTLVIVTSDNGAHLADVDGDTHGHRANGDWRGQKADIWEGGHREPFVARWPGRIPPGSVTDALFGLVDLMATIATATGVEVPLGAGEDSVDMLGVLTGGPGPSLGRSLVHHSFDGTFSLRHKHWKLVMGSGSGGFSEPFGYHCDDIFVEGQLYDLSEDPAETHNLWFEHPEVVDGLYAELKAIARGPASGLSFDVPSVAGGRAVLPAGLIMRAGRCENTTLRGRGMP